MKYYLRIIVFFVLLAPAVEAQQTGLSAYAEAGGYASSSDRTPFWLRANQWGRVPVEASIGTARLGFNYQSPVTYVDSTRRKARFNWSAGVEGVTNIGTKPQILLAEYYGLMQWRWLEKGVNNNDKIQFLLPEAYGKLRWRWLELMAGREKQMIGIVDSTLSSGSYSWSGNALPIPMVRLGLPDYVPLGFLGRFVSIKGTFAHGWFNVPYIKNAYLHQKTIHTRFGKPEKNVHGYLGLVHQVQWGGEAEYLKAGDLSINGKLPTDFYNYMRGVVLAQLTSNLINDQYNYFDGFNRIGNHIGHIDMAIDWRVKKTKFLLYRQHPFDDASSLQFQNLPDGLYGLSLQRNTGATSSFALKRLVLEYFDTRDQTHYVPGSRFSAGDNYFNHAQYREGWSYMKRTIGNPLLPTALETRKGFPDDNGFFPANRTVSYYMGLEAVIVQKVKMVTRISQGHYLLPSNSNYGSKVRQFSSLLSFEAPLSHWGDTRIKAAVAYDKGGLYTESLGGYLGIKSSFRKK